MLYEFETTVGAEASAPGTGADTSAPGSASSAGTQNTDIGADGKTPDTIPYSRFKEVNDELASLRGFRALSDVGYDADSLRQLAEFETSFKADPAGTWLAIAAQIDDLPQEMKDMAQRHLTGSPVDQTSVGRSPTQDGETPEWARDLQEKVDRIEQAEHGRAQRETSQAHDAALNGIMAKWKALDEKDQLPGLEETEMLTYIVPFARGASKLEEILENARGEYLRFREKMLGSAIKPGGLGAPLSVPGSGASAPANVDSEPKTLAEASIRAKQRLAEAGGS